jgi:hypothetical protein
MNPALAAAAAEIESHLGGQGWDRPPALFALVTAARLRSDEPATADRLGIAGTEAALTPVEQPPLPDGPLDEALARICWPPTVAGCALGQEILTQAPDDPARREARLVVAVLRDGSTEAVLRLRDHPEELLSGPDLAPNLAAALLATLQDDGPQ